VEFKSETQKACYETIKPWMQEIFGDFVKVSADQPLFTIDIPSNSALIRVDVYHWRDTDAIINVSSWVVTGVEPKPELMRYLLETNLSLWLGAFCMDKDGDIKYEYSLIGSNIDRDRLKSAVMFVVNNADNYDDQIVARFGGLRALDR
jgi:hypothetical protein